MISSLAPILLSEEEHVDWLETHSLSLIERVGVAELLQAAMAG